jgi:hypothetical protein
MRSASSYDLVGRLAVRRAVDDEKLRRLLARYGKDVHRVRGKIAGITGLELAALARNLRDRRALEHVANLLDAAMGVRQRTCPFSITPRTTSTFFAPTVSGPMRRRLTVPVWFAGL